MIFESIETLDAISKDPRFREGLKPMAAVAEKLPPELHVYDVDLVRFERDFGKDP